jgi:hypothetical protein
MDRDFVEDALRIEDLAKNIGLSLNSGYYGSSLSDCVELQKILNKLQMNLAREIMENIG